MRGKADKFLIPSTYVRITPAYAGKRRCGRRNGLCVQDHPRLCGEKKDRPPFSGCRLGSPPPMRGKGPDCFGDCTHDGITPAYAGKSRVSVRYETCHRDHPRLCGEKYMCVKTWFEEQGSPPPMRGKVREFLFFRFIFGITPAYAGKSV